MIKTLQEITPILTNLNSTKNIKTGNDLFPPSSYDESIHHEIIVCDKSTHILSHIDNESSRLDHRRHFRVITQKCSTTFPFPKIKQNKFGDFSKGTEFHVIVQPLNAYPPFDALINTTNSRNRPSQPPRKKKRKMKKHVKSKVDKKQQPRD